MFDPGSAARYETADKDVRSLTVRLPRTAIAAHHEANDDPAQADMYFQPAGGDANARLRAAEVLHDDGTYQVRFTLGGKPHGQYSFAVKGGKIEVQGRQDEHTEPANRIVDTLYGGRYRSWWIKREGGGSQVAK